VQSMPRSCRTGCTSRIGRFAPSSGVKGCEWPGYPRFRGKRRYHSCPPLRSRARTAARHWMGASARGSAASRCGCIAPWRARPRRSPARARRTAGTPAAPAPRYPPSQCPASGGRPPSTWASRCSSSSPGGTSWDARVITSEARRC
jgi:hypothetical protein